MKAEFAFEPTPLDEGEATVEKSLRPACLAEFIGQRRIVEILPKLSDKRQAVDISQQIAEDISAYLMTITVMNAAVGGATAAAMYLCGLGDPLLWGTAAFLLNYVPILGPLFGTGIFLLGRRPAVPHARQLTPSVTAGAPVSPFSSPPLLTV